MDFETLLGTVEQQERNISQLELELAQLQSGTFDSTEKVSGWNIVLFWDTLVLYKSKIKTSQNAY